MSLVELIIRNSHFPQNPHRLDDLQRCFRRIHDDDDVHDTADVTEAAQRDKNIVETIWKDFEDLFPELTKK